MRSWRKRPAVLPKDNVLCDFAAAWLAFDGFSPESARGPHTLNLFRARVKWRNFALQAALRADDDNIITTAVAVAVASSSLQGTAEVQVEAESTAEI